MTILHIGGIPVRVHASLALMCAVIFGATLYNLGLAAMAWAMVLVVGVVGSVLVHELGHAAAGRYFGIQTRAIVLYPFGGVAQLEQLWVRPRVDAWLAFAGPAASMLLGAGMVALGRAVGQGDVQRLGWINLGLGVLNLMPAFPMDGGRVLRAALVHWLGTSRGTVVTLLVGLAFVCAFVVVGAWTWQPEILVLSMFLLWHQRKEWLAHAERAG